MLVPAAVWVAAQRERVPGKTPGVPAAASEAARARPVYAHSVVPGGVYNAEEVESARRRDMVVSAHYAGIGPRLSTVRLNSEMRAHVSYRIGKAVYWTRNRVRIRAGEVLLTDGGQWIRARCGNRVSIEPRQPTLTPEPAEQALDTAEAGEPQGFTASAAPGGGRPAPPGPGVIPGVPATAAVKPPYVPEFPFTPAFWPAGGGGWAGTPSAPPPAGRDAGSPFPVTPPLWVLPAGPPFLPGPVSPALPEEDAPLPPPGADPLPPAPEEPTPPVPPRPPASGGGSSGQTSPQPPPAPAGGGTPSTPPAPLRPRVQPPGWLDPSDEPENPPFGPFESHDPIATPEPGTGFLLAASFGLWWLSRKLVVHVRAYAPRRHHPARGASGPAAKA
ncbi:MAG: hypothetical protein ACE15B_16265 [Bryobacteraceae bacterium]